MKEMPVLSGTLEWNVQYSVGVPQIDKQHAYLFELANRVARQIGKTGNEDIFRSAISDLHDYTRTHFEYEESILEKAGYEHLEEHRKMHELMRTRLALFTSQLQQGFFNKTEFAAFVEQWLTIHILREDMKYIPAVLRRGAGES